jgi:lysozyme
MTALVGRLKIEEGFSQHPYNDTVGCPTIGYGRNLRDVGISQAEAEYLLRNEVQQAIAGLDRSIPWINGLTQNRQSVLVDMAFNLGVGGLLEFKTFLNCLRSGDNEGAASAMLNSKWAGQVHARATNLANLIRSG